jgi:hypothetical protein
VFRGTRRWWRNVQTSVGNSRVRPEQAAAGALDDAPVSLWPRYAAHWLAAGYDSEPLRQLAALRPGKTGAALDLLPEALRSIGFDPAPADAEYAARCQAALDIVQRDLDVTGYGQYRMRPQRVDGWPVAMHAAFPDGSHWAGGWGMMRRMGDAELLFTASLSVSGTLEEFHEFEWPVCAVHGDDRATRWLAGTECVEFIEGAPAWWCTRAGHALAPVGELTAEIAKTR